MSALSEKLDQLDFDTQTMLLDALKVMEDIMKEVVEAVDSLIN